ncbi:GNAT family N-acetyltransferase [Sabulilitoribacter arenilitoris]|uniref:GNAT family N-acetyltransferase n=1 Tax=Wocania arenilitoris TaxID=2044858 RepID=A0AAE3JLV7_9FLAO|nr:GNAT family N-acetyltransferase [Wocania arenilitoris]MCF7569648.1 GNAT family N-acetyltransferase [Wocania arenilitoris]
MINIEVKLINPLEHQVKALDLLEQLNPNLEPKQIENMLIEMVKLPNYTCFGLFQNNKLIGISSGWTTIRIYCGKQIELDNVIIDSTIQSKGYGKYFMNAIKEWSLRNDYKSIGLNTYVQNSRSHKFYFNEGFKILGFHFEKRLA